MKTIPTPLTDSTEGSDGSQPECDDLADLARALERELAGEIEKVRVLHGAVKYARDNFGRNPTSAYLKLGESLAATEDAPMTGSTPDISLFSTLEDTVEAQPIPNGLAFWWARKGIGFGSLYMGIGEDGKFEVDTECMGAEFCAEVVTQAIEKALERQEKENQS